MNKDLETELEKYPYLKSYVKAFINDEEDTTEFIPSLIYFFKKICVDHELDEAELFEWDEETTQDFYSWGHNSRWANTFWAFLVENFDHCIEVAIWLAKVYGDKDIYEGNER